MSRRTNGWFKFEEGDRVIATARAGKRYAGKEGVVITVEADDELIDPRYNVTFDDGARAFAMAEDEIVLANGS